MRTVSSGSVRITWPAFSREELVVRLRTGIASLAGQLPVTRAVLFGSWASGRATAHSDIDVLVIYAGPPREDAFPLVQQCLRVRGLEPHVYTEDEAAAVAGTLERMMEDGVVLSPATEPE